MKKICFVFLIILLSPLVLSISTTMLPEYSPGETMIIEVQGNILEQIDRSDIIFKRAHVAIAVDYDVKRISNKYYIYAQLPTNPNNYTLYINDISTTVNGQAQTIDYNQTFAVAGNLTDYSISPGFIVTNKNFIINAKSNLDQDATINLDFPIERAVTLHPGSNIIDFSVDSVSPGFYLAAIGKYNMPIQINSGQQSSSSKNIEVFPRRINETVAIGNKKSYNFSLTNSGNNTLKEIYFTYNSEIFSLDKELISEINSSKSENILVTLKKTDFPISETILIASGSELIGNMTFNIFFTNNQSQITNSTQPQYYCSELGGRFCAASEVCSGTVVQALDGSCCTASCSKQQESSSNLSIYIFVGVIALILILIIFMRYRKSKVLKPKGLPLNSVLKKPI